MSPVSHLSITSTFPSISTQFGPAILFNRPFYRKNTSVSATQSSSYSTDATLSSKQSSSSHSCAAYGPPALNCPRFSHISRLCVLNWSTAHRGGCAALSLVPSGVSWPECVWAEPMQCVSRRAGSLYWRRQRLAAFIILYSNNYNFLISSEPPSPN